MSLSLTSCMMSVVGFIFAATCPAGQTANQEAGRGSSRGGGFRELDGEELTDVKSPAGAIVFIHSKQIMSRDDASYSEAGTFLRGSNTRSSAPDEKI